MAVRTFEITAGHENGTRHLTRIIQKTHAHQTADLQRNNIVLPGDESLSGIVRCLYQHLFKRRKIHVFGQRRAHFRAAVIDRVHDRCRFGCRIQTLDPAVHFILHGLHIALIDQTLNAFRRGSFVHFRHIGQFLHRQSFIFIDAQQKNQLSGSDIIRYQNFVKILLSIPVKHRQIQQKSTLINHDTAPSGKVGFPTVPYRIYSTTIAL